MRTWNKRLRAILVLLLVVAAGILFLKSQFARRQGCEVAKHYLPRLLGAEVRFDRCEVDLLAQTASLTHLSVYQFGDQAPTFSAESVKVRINALRPFFGSTQLDFVKVERPQVLLDLRTKTLAGHPRAAASRDCSLRFLKEVQVDQLELGDGQVRVQWDGHQIDLNGLGIEWKTDKKRAQFRIKSTGGSASMGEGREMGISALGAEGHADLPHQKIDFQRAIFALEDARVVLNGTVEELCDPKLSLQGQAVFPIKAAEKLLGLKGRLEGEVTADFALTGRPSDPIASVHLTGRGVEAGQFKPGDFTARLLYSGRDLTIEELALMFGPGGAKVYGKVTLAKNFPAQVDVIPSSAQFGKILENVGLSGAWVDFAATGRVSLSGHFLPSPSFSGEAEIKGSKFLLATRPYDADPRKGKDIFGFDQGRVSLGVRILGDRVEMHHVKGELARTRFSGNVTLHYDPMRGIESDAHADPFDLSDFRKIAGLHASGRGIVDAVIAGPYPDVQISAQLNLNEFGFWHLALGNVQGRLESQRGVLAFPEITGQKGRTSYVASGQIDFPDRGRMRWDLRIPKGRTEDLIEAVSGLSPGFKLFTSVLTGESTGTIHVDSPPEDLDGTVQLELKGTEFYGRKFGDGRFSLRFVDGQQVVVDQANLRGPAGQVSGSGSLSFEGPLAFQFRAQELSLSELVGAERARALGASGKFTVSGRIQGDSITPVVNAYVTSPGVRFANRELGETHLEAKIQGRNLQIWGRPFADAHAAAEVELKAPFAYSTNVSLSLAEIRPLLPRGAVAQGLSGAIAGTIKAEGNIAEFEDSELDASFSTLRLSRSDFTVENSAPVRLGYSNRKLKLTSFALRGPNTELALTGWIDPSKLDLRMNGTMDMRLLESFIPNIERTTGRIELSASASGATREPALLGRAEVRDTGLTLREPGVVVRSLSGMVEFSEARVLFQDFHGVVNDGRLSLRGTAQLEKFNLKYLELAAQVDELALRPVEELPLQLSGVVSLVGKPGAFTLGGDLDILKLRYERPVTLEKLLPEIQKGRGPTSYEPSTEWLTFDLGLHAKGDVRVENNVARAKLIGDLRLTGTNIHPGLLGTIQSTEGSQAFFRGNQFAIRQGLLEFKERKSIDTVFDVHAEARVREYLVRLHAFGRTSDPKAVLSSEPPLPEGDILSLLTLGVISTDKTNTAGASAGLAAEALFNASGLDRQVQRFLPRNPLLRDLSFHIATIYNDYTGFLEPSAQLESKFLTEQLKLRLTQPVSGRGTRAQAEYWFDERLSAQAQWDNEHTDYSNIPGLTSLGNFGLNLKLHWEVD